MNIEELKKDLEKDIPKNLALGAWRNLSHTPDKRGQRALDDYRDVLAGDYVNILPHADTPEKLAQLEEEFSRYRGGYSKRYTAWIGSVSRCMSSFIVGPSNFPVARARKYSRWEHNRSMALTEFRQRALNAIKRTLHPEWRPIMAGDDNAQERLKEKIKKAEEFQVQAKLINAALRKNKKAGRADQEAALKVLGLAEDLVQDILRPDCYGGVGVSSFSLANNNANLKRMKQRLAVISRDQAKEAVAIEGTNARLEDCPAENRVRLFFPGKPSAEVRGLLKSRGFRWTPTLGAWQAYRHHWTIETAKEIAGARAGTPGGEKGVL